MFLFLQKGAFQLSSYPVFKSLKRHHISQSDELLYIKFLGSKILHNQFQVPISNDVIIIIRHLIALGPAKLGQALYSGVVDLNEIAAYEL